MRESDANLLAANLADSELRGVDTHGLARVVPYLEQMRSGDVNPRPEIDLVAKSPVVCDVEGDHGYGVLAGTKAMKWAVEAARPFGLAMAGVRGVGHFGTASYYSRIATSRGFVGIAMSDTSPVVAPAGAAEPRLGNNPLSIAIPNGNGGSAYCLDIAMSVVSRGRVKMYALAGRELPDQWAIDKEGNVTRDAEAALDGSLLPFGGYKGSGLSMAVEILTGALTGGPLTQHIRHGGFTSAASGTSATDDKSSVCVSNLYLVIDPGVFRAVDAFVADVEAIKTYVRTSRPRDGMTIRIAGEPEEAAAAERARNGVTLSNAVLTGLKELAARLQVPFPHPVTTPDTGQTASADGSTTE